MTTVIFLAILGAILSAVIGAYWYSMKTPMGRIHMRYLGFDKLSREDQITKIREKKPRMWKSYLLQAILSFLTSFFLIYIVANNKAAGINYMSYIYVFMMWLAFIIPVVGSNILWSNVDRKIAWKKFFSDIFYYLVNYLVIIFITSLFF